jgi:hypothetical protein
VAPRWTWSGRSTCNRGPIPAWVRACTPPRTSSSGAPPLVLDPERGSAFDRELEEHGGTPASARGARAAGGEAEASSEPRVPPPWARADGFTRPAPAPVAAARSAGGLARPGLGEDPASAVAAEAQRPKPSASAAALSLAFLVAAAAVTFVAWRGSLSAYPGPAAVGAIEAEHVAAGPYDTAAGTPVLVVRGQVTARDHLDGPVQVEAQLWDDGSLVATAQGAAGATATPEEVYASGTPGEAEALRRALDSRAADGLAAGESAPFLILFPPPAPEMRGRELRVVASAPAGAR